MLVAILTEVLLEIVIVGNERDFLSNINWMIRYSLSINRPESNDVSSRPIKNQLNIHWNSFFYFVLFACFWSVKLDFP